MMPRDPEWQDGNAQCAWYGALKARKTTPQATDNNLWEQVHYTPRSRMGQFWETRAGNKNRDIGATIRKIHNQVQTYTTWELTRNNKRVTAASMLQMQPSTP